MPSRTKNVVINSTISVSVQLLRNIISFISRTIFIHVLGAEYLGINGLFTDILTLLSFAELGIGSAINFGLYKPIADKDVDKIKSLMNIYKKSYHVIGIVILFVGMCLTPFISDIVREASFLQENILVIYHLYLLNTVMSYFFAYKKSLIIAFQKNYIIDIYTFVFYIVQTTLQCILLICTHQFIIYLLITVIVGLATNIMLSIKADKMYPYLLDRNVNPINENDKKIIIESIKALFVYKVGGVVLESVDSIFVSILINISTVGLYSNYKLIVNIFKTISSQAMSSIVATVGNLNARSSASHKEKIFDEMLYISVWIVGFCSVGLYVFLTPFITLWIGKDYTLGTDVILPLCIYYYISFVHSPCYAYRTTTHVFLYGRFIPLIAALINIVSDQILGYKFGLSGIVWGTVLARFITYEIVDPLLIYKYVFKSNVIKYFFQYALYIGMIIIDAQICLFLISNIKYGSWTGLFAKVMIFVLAFNFLFWLMTCRKRESRELFRRIRDEIKV